MSNDNLPQLANPFFDRPDSPEYKAFEERRNRGTDKFSEAVERQSRTTLFQKTVDGRDIITGTEADRDAIGYRHEMDGKPKHGRDAIFFFPESFNALRKELYENWPKLWAVVGWRMANRAEEFVEGMNAALDIAVMFDTEKVDFISRTFYDSIKGKPAVLDTLFAERAQSVFTAPVMLRDDFGKE
jgi:hypothetical protein